MLVLTLERQSYQEQRFTGAATIASPTFPNLNLTAEQVLKAGQSGSGGGWMGIAGDRRLNDCPINLLAGQDWITTG